MMIDMTKPSIKMIFVRIACTDAPPGPNRDEALMHYASAVEARHAMREADSNKQLDAAIHALSRPPA